MQKSAIHAMSIFEINAAYQRMVLTKAYTAFLPGTPVQSIIVGPRALGTVKAVDSKGFVHVEFTNVNNDGKPIKVTFFADGLPLRRSGWGRPIQRV
jgi:hypothetical protein